jgi:3-oxoacyl-[acyl-carrier-protein] synthase II
MISITGAGIICNMGSDRLSVMNNLINLSDKKVGHIIGYPRHYDENYRKDLSIVAEVPISNKTLYEKLKIKSKKLSHISRSELLAIYAIQSALDNETCQFLKYDKTRIGIFCGTSQASTIKLEQFYKNYKKEGKVKSSRPLLSGTYNIPNKLIAQHFGLSGVQSCISTACSSSLVALHLAESYLLTNQIDAAIVYGVDPISELVIGGFKSLQAMANGFSTPFSNEDIGMSLGEGAAAIFLEKNSSNPIAYLSGTGCSSDAYHITAPDPTGSGAHKSIFQAYASMEVKPEICDVIYAHGSGTQANDECESRALTRYFGKDYVKNIPILSLKGAIGHTLGAAGLMNAVLACESIEKGIIPPSPGFQSIRPECDSIQVNSTLKKQEVSNALINAFGFGGNNASAFLSKYDNRKEIKHISMEPIYIKGFGFITSVGDTIEDLYNHVFSEKEAPITDDPVISFTGRFKSIGSSTTKNYQAKIEKKLRKLKNFRKLDKFSKLVIYSAIDALEASGVKWSKQAKEELPLILGTGTGPMEAIHTFYNELLEEGIDFGNPGIFPNNVMNGSLGFLSIEEHIKGPTILCSDHEFSSVNAFRNAWILLNNHSKHFKQVLAGGSDEYSVILEKGYLDLFQIKTRNREGYIMGEISTSILFENDEQHRASKTRSHAIYKGGTSRYFNNFIPKAELFDKYNNFLLDMTMIHGKPDLLLFSSKNNSNHDNILLKSLNHLFPNTHYYTPINQFGYYQGCVTALNFILAIMFLECQRFPGASEKKHNSINNIFVITIAENEAIALDILQRDVA